VEAQQTSRYDLTPEQVKEVERIQQQVRDGTAAFASDEQMAAFWKKSAYEIGRQRCRSLSFPSPPCGRGG
jgi:hypothetical protein